MRTIRTEEDSGSLFFWNAKNAYTYILAVCERGDGPLQWGADCAQYDSLERWLAFAPVGSIEAGFYDILWITILDDKLVDSTGSQPDGVEIVDFKDGDFEDFMRSKGFVFIAEPQWIYAPTPARAYTPRTPARALFCERCGEGHLREDAAEDTDGNYTVSKGWMDIAKAALHETNRLARPAEEKS